MVSDTLLAFLATESVLIASYDDIKGLTFSLHACLGYKLGVNHILVIQNFWRWGSLILELLIILGVCVLKSFALSIAGVEGDRFKIIFAKS